MRTALKILIVALVVVVASGAAFAWWAASPTAYEEYVAPVSVEDRALTEGVAEVLGPVGVTDYDWAKLDDGLAVRYALPTEAEGNASLSEQYQRYVLAAVMSASNGTIDRLVAWQQAGDADVVWTLKGSDWAAYRAGEIDEAGLEARIEKGTTPP